MRTLTNFLKGLLGHDPNERIALVSYGNILCLSGVFLNSIWWYAKNHRLIDEGLDLELIQFMHRYIRVAPILYLISISVAFINLTLAKFISLVVAIFSNIPNPLHLCTTSSLLNALINSVEMIPVFCLTLSHFSRSQTHSFAN